MRGLIWVVMGLVLAVCQASQLHAYPFAQGRSNPPRPQQDPDGQTSATPHATPKSAPADQDAAPTNQPGQTPSNVEFPPSAETEQPGGVAGAGTPEDAAEILRKKYLNDSVGQLCESLGGDAPPPSNEAPRECSSWEIQGHLLEPEVTLREVVRPVMDRNRYNWGSDGQLNVRELFRKLGYEVAFNSKTKADGSVHAVLLIEPVPLLQEIQVDIDMPSADRLQDPIFSDDMSRRISLRPGDPLAIDQACRMEVYKKEKSRLEDFLKNDGFFDAKVTIREERTSLYGITLSVSVWPGQVYHLGKIRVDGNTAIATDEILEIFHDHAKVCIFTLCFGKARFSRLVLNRDVEKIVELYHQRGYPAATVQTDFSPVHSFQRRNHAVEFTVTINERRKVDVEFVGNEKASSTTLSELTTFSEHGAYDDIEIGSSAEAIRHYYQSKGYFEARVFFERERHGSFERITFFLQEGPNLRVRNVSFRGNVHLSADHLQGILKTKQYRKIILRDGGGFVTNLQLAQDQNRILAEYRQHGFPSARVWARVSPNQATLNNAAALAALVATNQKVEGLFVQFYIEEGPLVSVADVRFEGDSPIAYSVLRNDLKLASGKPFSQTDLQSDEETVQQRLLEAGYPRGVVESTMEDLGGNQVVVVHHINAGKQVRYGKVILRGNFHTKEWVLKDELGFSEGKLFTISSRNESESRLRAAGLFSTVKVDYIGEDDPNQSVVHALVRVEEAAIGETEISGGWATDSLWFTEFRYRRTNLFGVGLRWESRFLLGQRLTGVDTKLVFPHWLVRRFIGTPLLFELGAFYNQEDTTRFGEVTSWGGNVIATKEFSGRFRDWRLSMRYDFRKRTRDIDLRRPSGNSDDIQREKVPTLASTIGPVLQIDRRQDVTGNKNPLAPSSGYSLETRLQFGEDVLIGDDRFIKFGASFQHFWPLGSRVTLSNGLRYDQGFPLRDAAMLPELERFFAGGDTTVRGYPEDRLASTVIESEIPGSPGLTQLQVVPMGGNIRAIHNLDVQVRVADIKEVPIASAIFLDTGEVRNSWQEFEFTHLRHSLGLGIRIVTPFLIGSLEWAIPLDPNVGDDRRGRWHIRLGFLFGS